MERIKNLYFTLEKENLDCLILSSWPNITYLTKYTSRDSYLLISKKQNIYFTDSRYIEEAKIYLKGIAEIKKINGSVFKLIAAACRELRCKRVGFEERAISFNEYQKLKQKLNKRIELVPTIGLVEKLREIKGKDELEKIEKAVEITLKALGFAKNIIVPGKKEIEVAAELERFIRYNGAVASAFDIIVASGPNSSYPHHLTSERKIKNNELVLVDMGVDYLGYKSDLTRVFFIGKMKVLEKRILDVVLTAQDRAKAKIKPGALTNEIDGAARNYITKKGYGRFFGHGLGHGVGLEVHEAPRISNKEKKPVRPGMVFTIEPGIYIPHKFGIRIEDMAVVTSTGCEVISGSFNK